MDLFYVLKEKKTLNTKNLKFLLKKTFIQTNFHCSLIIKLYLNVSIFISIIVFDQVFFQ